MLEQRFNWCASGVFIYIIYMLNINFVYSEIIGNGKQPAERFQIM